MRRMLIATAIGAIATGAAAQSHADSKHKNTPRFELCGTLLDATATNPRDAENKADIDDFVVDTRTGKAAFALLDTNGILGSDDKVVAIPYGALTWHRDTGQFTVAVTAEQLRNLPACDPGDLAHLESQSWYSTLRGIFDDRREIEDLANVRGDEYSSNFGKDRIESMKGTIVAVHHEARTAQGNTCYAVVVADTDRKERHTVFLAPMTYLTSQPFVPSEGDDVTVKTVRAIDAEGNVVRVAQTIRGDGETIRLRDKDGHPAWDSKSGARSCFTLASAMDDGALYATGEKFGSVSDIVFETNSGTVAFAVVSKGGILGIDDTLYPVPCGAISPGQNGNLFVEMPTAKLKLAPKLSEDGASDLNDMGLVKRVCRYFGVTPKDFDLDRSSRWMKEQKTARK